VRFNGVTTVPDLGGMTSLRLLDLTYNNVREIGGLGIAPGLEQLWLGFNAVETVHEDAFSGLSNLAGLELNDNRIQDIAAVGSLDRLTYLQLGRNRVRELDALINLQGLQNLALYNNVIEDIAPLSGLTELVELDLQSNTISDVRPLSGLSALAHLDLKANPLIPCYQIEDLKLALPDTEISSGKCQECTP